MKFSGLIQHLQLPGSSEYWIGAVDPELRDGSAIDEAQPGTLSFLEGQRFEAWVAQTQASALILPPVAHLQALATERQIAWVASDHPRLLFAQALGYLYQPWSPATGVHTTAVIHPSVHLGAAVTLGAHVVLHADVRLGDGVCIHDHVVVYPGVTIGDRTRLHAHCVIHERTAIGQDCIIQSGAVIGAEGFGFVPTEQGWTQMPQSGRVVLADQVYIGCNTTVDRPAVGETRIGEGCKLDNLVHIGHGCQLGPHCVLVGQVGLAGHVTLGARVVLGGQVGVADYVQVGAGAIATARSGITKTIPAGETVSGYPALPKQVWLKMMAATRKLPELMAQWRQSS